MLRIAHRGASGYAPENTLKAFDRAIELGADMIECDIHRCKSGELIVFHDRTLQRMARRPDAIADMTYPALRQVQLAEQQTISSLQDAIRHIAGRCSLCIELKEKGLVPDTLALIEEAVKGGPWKLHDFWVISFFHHEIAEAKRLMPALQTGIAMRGLPLDYAACASLAKADAVHPDFQFIDEAFVVDAHARGLKVHVWTADEPYDIHYCFRIGVDGIASNYPDRIAL